jgi:hypothetical protein
MHYTSGDVFHGEWVDNVRAGQGKMVRLLLRRANGSSSGVTATRNMGAGDPQVW